MHVSRFDQQFSANITVMVRAARAAARSLVRDFGEVEKLQVSQKGPGDFVSKADINAEKKIIEELQKARPDFGFLTEEHGEIKGADETHRWIVDPLDGTMNFLHGIPHWSISIALEEKTIKGNEIVAAVVYDPIKDELFTAEKNAGAFLTTNRLRVSGRTKLADCVVATGAPTFGDQDIRKLVAEDIKTLYTQVADVRRLGSAALDLCYVAAGRYDCYLERKIKYWDIAAGMLIVREAGGMVTDFTGRDEHVSKGEIIAGNPKIQKMVTQLVK